MSENEVVSPVTETEASPAPVVIKAKSTRKPTVKANDFLAAFAGSESYKDVADKTGLPVQSVRIRSANYRKKGINVPKFTATAGARRIDVANANAFLAKILATENLAEDLTESTVTENIVTE
jgi:hypothetical protein